MMFRVFACCLWAALRRGAGLGAALRAADVGGVRGGGAGQVTEELQEAMLDVDVGSGRGDEIGYEGERVDDSGTFGKLGRLGYRTLGRSCWDNDVWPHDKNHHLTLAMCAKTRAHRTWSHTAKRMIKKLHRGQCVTVVAIGSSLTYGNCVGCWLTRLPKRERRAWPNQFKKWLDAKWPCHDREGGHTVLNLAEPASDSSYWSMRVNVWRWNTSHVIHSADMVIADTALTDVECQLQTNPPLLIEPPQGADEWISPATELLIRQLKSIPNKPWILFAELTWRYEEKHIMHSNHWDATLVHLPVIKYYDADQVSLLDAFLPMKHRKHLWMKYLFLIDGGHATPYGHQLIGQILGHTLMEESHFMNMIGFEHLTQYPLAWNLSLPEPYWLSRELAQLYDDVPVREIIPKDDPWKHVYDRHYMEFNNGQIFATWLKDDYQWPQINFWVNLTWGQTRPKHRGYASLGLRRLMAKGSVKVLYHVQKGVLCGGEDHAIGEYRVGLDFEPYWPIDSSLRISRGFFFNLPPTRTACLIMILQWRGDRASVPYNFLVDDLVVLA